MRDQPDLSEESSTPRIVPGPDVSPPETPDNDGVEPRLDAAASDQAPDDAPTPDTATDAESADPPMPPTLVTVEAQERQVPAWLKIGAGLGGIVLLAIIGW